MKTTLLILWLTCFGAWAQTPGTVTDSTDPATRDAMLRNALRVAMGATNNNGPTTTPPATNITPTVPAATVVSTNNPRPAFPAFPTLPAPGSRRSARQPRHK